MALDMSSEELRAHLFRSLQERGVLDSLKSHLRNRLATELQKSLGSGSSAPPTPVTSSMTLQVANNIVAEHLKKAGYEYSLSVFLPEAGVDSGRLFSPGELLQFMKIAPPSPLHDSLLEGEKQHGFLVAMVMALAAHGSPASVESAAVQTEGDGSGPARPSVAARLQALDESYAGRVEEEGRRHQRSLQERMAAFQQEAEARYRGQLETEMAHFRERELTRVRQEERGRGQEELLRERAELHHAHQLKLEAVRRMEQETLLRLRRKEQELEAGLYAQRQALLSELDALRARESELKRQAEVERLASSVGEARVRSVEQQLAEKEKALEVVRAQREAEEEAQRQQAEREAGLQSKRAELSRWEAELGGRQQELEALREECRSLGGEVKGERGRAEELQRQLHEATVQQGVLQQHKEQLQQKLSQLSDYPHLQQKVSELGKQLQASERQLAGVRAEHRKQSTEQLRLQRRLAQPSAEHLALQAEVEEARRTHQREMVAAEYEGQRLRSQLVSQSELCARLQRQVAEQTVQLRGALREVEDVRLQLRHQIPPTAGRRPLSQPKKVTLAASKPTRSHHPPLPTPRSPAPHRPSQTLTDAPGELLEESRAVFARLEQEAQELEQTYRLFQQRVAGGYADTRLQEPASLLPSLPSPSLPHPSLLHSLLEPGSSTGRDTVHTAVPLSTSLGVSVPAGATPQLAALTAPVSAPGLFQLTPSSAPHGALSALSTTQTLAAPASSLGSQPPDTALSHTSHAQLPPSTIVPPHRTVSSPARDRSRTARQTHTTAAISAPVMSATAAATAVRAASRPSASVITPVRQSLPSTGAPLGSVITPACQSLPSTGAPLGSAITQARQSLPSTGAPLGSVSWTTTTAEHKLLPELTRNSSSTGGGGVFTAVTGCLISASGITPPTLSVPPSTTRSAPPSTSGVPSSTHSAPPSTSGVPSSTHSAPPSTSGVPSSTHSAPPSTSGVPSSTHSAPPSISGVPSSTHSAPPSISGVPSSTHSAPPSTSGNPPSVTVPVTTAPPGVSLAGGTAPGHQVAQSKVVADGLQSHATTSTADTQTVDSREHTSGLATSATPLSPGPTLVAAGSPDPTPVAAGSVRGGAVPTVSLDDLWRVSSAPGGGVERSGEEQLNRKSPPSQHSAVSMGTISPPPGPNVEPIPVTAGVEPGQNNVAGMEPGQDNVAGMEPGQDCAGVVGLDPVMMKYMELVQQRREQQKAQAIEEAGSPLPEEEGPAHSQLGAAGDYGLPSLSQPSDRDRFSDDGSPFDDW